MHLDIDFQLFWSGLTQGGNLLLTTLAVLLTWFVGRFLVVVNRRSERAIEKGLDVCSNWVGRKRRVRAVAKAKNLDRERLAKIRKERVGRQFLRRSFQGDRGMTGEVVDLSRNHPELAVVILWSNPAGRPSHHRDYGDGDRLSIEWRYLVASEKDQIHYTARHVVGAQDDAEGWVEFEEIGA